MEIGHWSRAIHGQVVHYWPDRKRPKDEYERRQTLCGAWLMKPWWMHDTDGPNCEGCERRYGKEKR